MNSRRVLAVIVVSLITFGVEPGHPTSHTASAQDKKDPQPKLPTEPGIMAAKLKHAEALISAVTLQNYQQIQKHATALRDISLGAEFLNARRTDEYRYQSTAFQRAAATMASKAADKNIDGVMLAYLDLTKSCLACHQSFNSKKID